MFRRIAIPNRVWGHGDSFGTELTMGGILADMMQVAQLRNAIFFLKVLLENQTV